MQRILNNEVQDYSKVIIYIADIYRLPNKELYFKTKIGKYML